jgi:hypothetical protein
MGKTALQSLDRMIAWEEGSLGEEETVELFQDLIDSGEVWRLQGCYGRQAAALIEGGYCTVKGGGKAYGTISNTVSQGVRL